MQRDNFYAGSGLDRAAERRRDSDWIDRALADPLARIVPLWRNRNLVAGAPADADSWKGDAGGGAPEAVWLGPAAFDALHADDRLDDQPVFLGIADTAPVFAVDLVRDDDLPGHPALHGEGLFHDLRAVGPVMESRAAAILALARGIATWHRNHRHCGVCGSPTLVREAGHQRRCTNTGCDTPHFPRTDPAVIMLVTHGDECLLGRQKVWPPGMYSTLAGFVEPGESLEEAVAREVFEESGIRVREVTYRSSQPWPFPSSIMLGFEAVAETSDIRIDPRELEDARWFSRNFIRDLAPDGAFRTPRRDSIAWRLISDWIARG